MPPRRAAQPLEPFALADALLRAFRTNERVNQYLLEHLAPVVWNADPPGGKGRTAGAIVSHMHNVRVMWLKAAAKGSMIPEQLDRHTVTPAGAVAAFGESARALEGVLEAALAADGQVKGFKPDVAGFFGYLVAHDAHHRGQLVMLARQLGSPISQSAMFGMWEWGSRGKEL
ncbi:MAG: DinB family protein [Gemmatimonadaceae bacterium]